MTQQLIELVGQTVSIYMKNEFRYTGKITHVNEKYIIINDIRRGEAIIFFENISGIETTPTNRGNTHDHRTTIHA